MMKKTKVEITVSKESFKTEIKRLLYFFENKIIMDDYTKAILIKYGMQFPKELSDDRFSIQVDPDLNINQLVYQFI